MSKYEIFNSLAQDTLAKPRLSNQELLDLFLRIEDRIFYAVDLLLQTTTFVEDSLCYALSEIATGVIKSRKIYRGKRSKRRVSVGGPLDLGAENYKALSLGFDLFKLSQLPRSEAVTYTRRVLRQTRFSTHIYEQILRSFVRETSNYLELSNNLVEVELLLRQVPNDAPARPRLEALLLVRKEELKAVEEAVGCARPNRLYGVVKVVTHLLREITRKQEQVLTSYQRMVLQQSRNKSFTDNEALDLFQAGSLGLNKAVSLWDIDGDSSFPVFASLWIRQRILGSSKMSGPLIKLPWSVWEGYTAVKAAERELENDPKLRNSYTDADVAKLVGKSVKAVQKIREKVAGIRYVSLETTPPRNDATVPSDGATLSSTLEDPRTDEAAEMQETKDTVRSLLLHLSPEERRLTCLRFGLVDELHQESADRLGVVKELFRQAACRAALYEYLTKGELDSRKPSGVKRRAAN